MLKKIISLLTCVFLLGGLTVGCQNTENTENTSSVSENGNVYPKIRINMSTTVSDQSNAAVTAQLFADLVAEASDGNIEVKVYSSDQLSGGNMSKGVEMLTQGAIDCAFEPVDVLSVLDSSLLALSMPWTFESYEEAEECLNEEGGDYIREVLQSQKLETLGFIHNGFRQLTNSKQSVEAPEDLKGMKIRVPGGDVFVKCFKELGADPISMSFSELFTALQQGTVDGQENGFDLIVTNKFYEVQPYITQWNYSYGAFALVFNKENFDGYDENVQELLMEKAKEACRQGCQNVVDGEAEKKQAAQDYGCEITELSDEQIAVFREALQNYYAEMKEQYGEDVCRAFGIE